MFSDNVLRASCVCFFVLLLGRSGSGYEEKNASCPNASDVARDIPSTDICDGTADCATGTTENGQEGFNDESPEICAPLQYLEKEVVLESREVTSTSALLSWSKVMTHVASQKLKLAGYFLSGKSAPHTFQNTISSRLTSYQVQWMKPWTDYRIILRPFYTDSGKPESTYKIGKAAWTDLRTGSSEPEAPSLVSVVWLQQRNVVLSIVGPSAWNSDPVGFHLRWEATSERRGPRRELDIKLPIDWSPEENLLNVTLPLQGGMDYRVSVWAVGRETSGTLLQGTAMEVSASVPLDTYELSAVAIDSSKAVISWRASEAVEIFRVTVYTDHGAENLEVHTTRKYEGSGKVNSKHNVIITKLKPWTLYVVRLEGCTGGNCSDAVNTTFSTLPESFPAPLLTTVKATSTSSFELAWMFPQADPRVYGGFRVRYCPRSIVPCFLVSTSETNLTVSGLEPGTVVDIHVAAQIPGAAGRPLVGPESTATVTTWSNVPVAQVWYEASIEDGIRSSLLSWICTNSSVDYLQYRLTDREIWTTCDHSADCDVTVIEGRTEAFTTGDMRLAHHYLTSKINILVRCCNAYGCGQGDSVNINSPSAVPPSLRSVTAVPNEQSVMLRYVPEDSSEYDGLEVTCHCNGDKKVTYQKTMSQYSVYRGEDCEREAPRGWLWSRPAISDPCCLIVPLEGLPTNAKQCEFFVSLYRDLNGQRYYSLPVQAVEE